MRRMIRNITIWLKVKILKRETVLNVMVRPFQCPGAIKSAIKRHNIPSEAIIIAKSHHLLMNYPCPELLRITWIANKKHIDMQELIDGVEMNGYEWKRINDYDV